MRKFLLPFLVSAVALSASAAPRQLLSMTDENEGGISYVTSFEYDANGRLVKITDDNTVFTFDYSQLDAKKFTMTRVDSYEWSSLTETYVTQMTLNDDNLVVKAVEIEDGEMDDDYFTFEYTNGYLTNVKQVSPDEVEETRISYADGRITKVENIDGSQSESDITTFDYDGGIMNPGGLVVFDHVFDMDLDDLEYVAMTGLLGKIYTELPTKAIETDYYGTSEENFKWTVDAEGYATSLEIKDEWDTYKYSFEWSANSGVNAISADNSGESMFFSLDGKRVSSSAKGIVIERRADGSSVKHINR